MRTLNKMAKFITILLCFCLAGEIVLATEEPIHIDLNKVVADFTNNLQEAAVQLNQKVLDILGYETNENAIQGAKVHAAAVIEKLEEVKAKILEDAQKNSHIFDDAVKMVNEKMAEVEKFAEERNPELVQEVKRFGGAVQEKMMPVVDEVVKLGSNLEAQREPMMSKIEESVNKVQKVFAETVQKANKEMEKLNKV